MEEATGVEPACRFHDARVPAETLTVRVTLPLYLGYPYRALLKKIHRDYY